MFYDKAKIFVKGGDGGNGIVAFRREKYVPEGGPNGGDGGRGGHVIFQADEGLRTLVDFRYKRHYKAERGEHGKGKGMHGRNAPDMMVRVPVGTVVRDADTGSILVDFTAHGQEKVIAKGGKGGLGNAHFTSSTRQTPHFAEKGESGEELSVEMELKLLADVGLVGFPNAGKSTLIAAVSAAKPKIADYPFTTLVPNLGVVRAGEGESFVMADIPGLIEGAHTGQGLGHEFLRHVERTRLLIHVVDTAGTEGRDPVEDVEVINRELSLYNERLATRPQVIAANKMDVPGAEENLARLIDALGEKYRIFPISAVTGQGTQALLGTVLGMLKEILPEPEPVAEEKITIAETGPPFTVGRDEDGAFLVTGRELERQLAKTDLENEEAVERFQRILRRMGVDDELRKAGVKEGDTVRLAGIEFEWTE